MGRFSTLKVPKENQSNRIDTKEIHEKSIQTSSQNQSLPAYDVRLAKFGIKTLLEMNRQLDLKILSNLIKNGTVPSFSILFSKRIKHSIIIPPI